MTDVEARVKFALPTVVLPDGRVALVVGNSTYHADVGRLSTPDTDAADTVNPHQPARDDSGASQRGRVAACGLPPSSPSERRVLYPTAARCRADTPYRVAP